MVTLGDLHRDGARYLRGTYTARLPVRSGVNPVLLIDWPVRGPRETPPGCTGPRKLAATEEEIEFKLASDGRLFVERIQSRDQLYSVGRWKCLLRR